MKQNISLILLFSILIRFLLLPWFYHPDIKSQYFHFQFFSQGHFNIYQYISDNKNNLPYRDTFNYLPLTYGIFGIFHTILSPLMPSDFHIWLNDWGINRNNYLNLPYFLLILKIPYLIFDILTGILLFKITKKLFILKLWLFNPLSFYFIYILGNFDIIPTYLCLLSYYYLNKKGYFSPLILGIAISFKLYPLIFLPFFALKFSKNIFDILKYTIFSFIPLFITTLPFLYNPVFLESFIGSGLSQKILELRYFSVPLFPSFYMVALFLFFFSKNKNLPKYIFIIFLLFISTVYFHPQWLLWFFPFFFLINRNIILTFIPIIFSIIFALIYNDDYLFWGHLLPIDSSFLLNSSPYNLIRYRFLINPQIVQNYLKITIQTISLFFIFFYEKILNHNHN